MTVRLMQTYCPLHFVGNAAYKTISEINIITYDIIITLFDVYVATCLLEELLDEFIRAYRLA